jgi:hypothetical protein
MLMVNAKEKRCNREGGGICVGVREGRALKKEGFEKILEAVREGMSSGCGQLEEEHSSKGVEV